VTETSDVPLYTDTADRPLFSETPEEREFELRAAVGSYWTGGRLLIGMYTFLFASLAFAYFYLRSNNSGKLWRPDNVTAPTGIGWAIFAVVLASVLLTIYGQWRMRSGSILDWEVSGWTAVGGMLLAIGLQIWQFTQLPFFPGSSGYASCFIGWGAMNIMLLVGGAYWLETNLALCLRLKRQNPEEGSLATATAPSAQLFRANVESCTYFFGFIAVISALFWVFFYLM
jgi:heme/copper-type cytochrome/quinol oxidase subunit 3